MPRKPPDPQSGVLVDAAKILGSTVGKLAVKTGIAAPEPQPATTKKPKYGKLQKRIRTRIPRLQKKELKKQIAVKGPVTRADLARLVS